MKNKKYSDYSAACFIVPAALLLAMIISKIFVEAHGAFVIAFIIALISFPISSFVCASLSTVFSIIALRKSESKTRCIVLFISAGILFLLGVCFIWLIKQITLQ